jgi:hypothetical protein
MRARSSILARASLDLAAGTETFSRVAVSTNDNPSTSRSNSTPFIKSGSLDISEQINAASSL